MIEEYSSKAYDQLECFDASKYKNLLIDTNISLFKFLLTNLKITEKKIEIKYMKPSNKIIVKNLVKI